MNLRVKMLIESLGYSPSSFAKRIGFNQSNLSKILRGEREVPANLIEKLLDNTNVNRAWLLTGEGSMLVSDNEQLVGPAQVKSVTENTHGVRFLETSEGMLINVPVVSYTALGSPVDEYAQLLQNEGCERISFPVDGIHHGKYFAFRVEGESMDDGTRDGFRKGDIVLVRELDRQDWAPKLHISKWPFWVICWQNCVRLKQIVAQSDDGSTITCHSLNPSPEYCDFILNIEDVSRLFNVIQVVQRRVFG